MNWEYFWQYRFCTRSESGKNMSILQATLVENRLPSGSSNPYLTTAVTIAAGIDGIINKLEPPPMYQQGK